MSQTVKEYYSLLAYPFGAINNPFIIADTTTIYLHEGALKHLIRNLDCRNQIVDFTGSVNIPDDFNFSNVIEYIDGVGTIINSYLIPAPSIIRFTNAPYIIINLVSV